jgi:hypothetical protein
MIDNAHVVVLRGNGCEITPVPEMEASRNVLASSFVAHRRGDANRSEKGRLLR